jgi:hypothetical protein
MAVPTPLDATTGTKISAAAFDSGVRDPLNFLNDPPHCAVYNNAGIACADGTLTLLTFDTETDDTDTMHSTSSNTSRVIFTTAGRYEITAFTSFGNFTFTVHSVRINKNGAGASGTGTIRTFGYNTPRQTCTTITQVFAASDYIEVWVQQTSTASRTSDTGQYATGVQARWIGIN